MDTSAAVATFLIVRQIERLLPEYAQRLGYTMDFDSARKSVVFEPLAGRAIFVRAAGQPPPTEVGGLRRPASQAGSARQNG